MLTWSRTFIKSPTLGRSHSLGRSHNQTWALSHPLWVALAFRLLHPHITAFTPRHGRICSRTWFPTLKLSRVLSFSPGRSHWISSFILAQRIIHSSNFLFFIDSIHTTFVVTAFINLNWVCWKTSTFTTTSASPTGFTGKCCYKPFARKNATLSPTNAETQNPDNDLSKTSTFS